VYFGGGTPSFLSEKQLRRLVDRLQANIRWDQAEEVTFECEPGTLSEPKVQALRELGVTRLSLGVEHFDDEILRENGRAHESGEIYRAWPWIRAAGFPNVNIDLIAGMVGDNDTKWREAVRRALELEPDSVTIYQMELPYNTTISGDMLKGTGQFAETVANWATKRRWVQEAFAALEHAGYHIGSAYTAVKNPAKTKFVYRDRLWEGADLLGLGVASFGHINGVHVQNLDTWPKYQAAIEAGEIPLGRAYRPTDEERLIREFVLQLKRGSNSPLYFARKYGVDVLSRFAGAINSLRDDGYLAEATPDRIALTRDALMRVDVLLPRFFLPQHTGIRYT
jgi:oxygen-independent coproporphyrinogen-3 oxidase